MKIIFIFIGMLCLILGSIGIILPILPTTPFLLAATYCFARGSKKINLWFQSTTIYKKHLQSFVQNREMTLKTKITILSFASTMLAFPLLLSNNIIIKLFIIILYIIKYYYFCIKIDTI